MNLREYLPLDQLLESLNPLDLVSARPGLAVQPDPRLRDAAAAKEFEAYMLKMLLAEMRKGISSGGLFTSSTAKTYEAILDDALARRAAEAGSFGLAEQMLREWERTQ